MKKRLLIAVVFAIVLITALSVAASAKWWDDNPFKDVKSDAWYYDAVRITNENELFNGTSDTTFTPNMKMTRAMLAQVLANADGYDKSEYTGSSFKDVKANAWYASAVEWASRNGVTSGTGGGKFSPNAEISREQLATMLKRYSEYKGMKSTAEAEADLDLFADANNVSDWAKQGLEWAVANGVVKGADKKGTLYLNPKNTAQRSECAQMLSNFLYLEPRYEINGNDISLYSIVYNANTEGGDGPTVESAEYLAEAIKLSLGLELPVVDDSAAVSEYEILIGWTNREEQGLVSVDRDSFEDDHEYIWSVQGNRLVIAGIDEVVEDNKAQHNISGTENAVFQFCEKVLGFYEYIDEGELNVCETDPVISLEDGYFFKDMIWYKTRTFYMKGSVNGSGDYYESTSNNISQWIAGNSSDDVIHDATPCMTDEANIEAIITNIRAKLSRPGYMKNLIGVGINDSLDYCKCSGCMEVYRQYKARSAALVLLVNRIAETFENEFPGVKFLTGAYEYCQTPPRNVMLHENIMIEFYTVKNCSGHAYSDTSCKVNKDLAENYAGWDAICSGGFKIWDHTGGFNSFMTPQADWDSLLENVRFFAEGGAREILMNSVFYGKDLPNGEGPSKHADLGNIRAYMLSMIYMDPYMSEEEFYYRLDNCLKANYGDGWKYIREYIDIISELGNSKDHTFHAPPGGHYDLAEVAEKADYISSLWENAKALTQGEELERLTLHETSWIYLCQSALHESRCENGTEEQRAEYAEMNRYLYNCILDMRLLWTEGTLNPLDNYGDDISPEWW